MARREQFRRDLTGQKFGQLVVKERIRYQQANGRYRTKWRCLCDCGNEVDVFQEHLIRGDTTSCGCTRLQSISLHKIKDGYYFYLPNNPIGYGLIDGVPTFMFDIEDEDVVCSATWLLNSVGYVTATNSEKLHAMIMQKYHPKKHGYVVDHINGNMLDNRKCNLRYIKHRDNIKNSKVRKDSPIGIRGVHKTQHATYHACIVCDGIDYNLGTFNTLQEAIDARRNAEIRLYGDYCQDVRVSVISPEIPHDIPDNAIIVQYNWGTNTKQIVQTITKSEGRKKAR